MVGFTVNNEEYYVLGHVSKFLDPGAVRIGSTEYDNGKPKNVAFQNPSGSCVLIVHAAQECTFRIVWQGNYFIYKLPAQGTATFVWEVGKTIIVDT